MIKFISFLIISIFIFIFSFLSLGIFLDATSNPSKTQLLVCLGGGDYKTRIKKTLELYEADYLSSNTIMLTGYVNNKNEVKKGIIEDKRVTFIKQYYKNVNIVLNKNLKNTAEEIKFIKSYMVENKIKNVTFISDPAHSRRILLFSSLFDIEGDEKLEYKVIGAYDKHWDKNTYYENKYSRLYAFTELSKIFYAIFAYGILENIGLLSSFEEYFQEEIKEGKKFIHKNLISISY